MSEAEVLKMNNLVEILLLYWVIGLIIMGVLCLIYIIIISFRDDRKESMLLAKLFLQISIIATIIGYVVMYLLNWFGEIIV